jgi:hypothetical protein
VTEKDFAVHRSKHGPEAKLKEEEARYREELRRHKIDMGLLTAGSTATASFTLVSATSTADAAIERILAAPTHYAVLNLHPADLQGPDYLEVIKRKFHQISRALHPDRCKSEQANEAMARVNEAKESLEKFPLQGYAAAATAEGIDRETAIRRYEVDQATKGKDYYRDTGARVWHTPDPKGHAPDIAFNYGGVETEQPTSSHAPAGQAIIPDFW